MQRRRGSAASDIGTAAPSRGGRRGEGTSRRKQRKNRNECNRSRPAAARTRDTSAGLVRLSPSGSRPAPCSSVIPGRREPARKPLPPSFDHDKCGGWPWTGSENAPARVDEQRRASTREDVESMGAGRRTTACDRRRRRVRPFGGGDLHKSPLTPLSPQSHPHKMPRVSHVLPLCPTTLESIAFRYSLI